MFRCFYTFKRKNVYYDPSLIGTVCTFTTAHLSELKIHQKNHDKLICIHCGQYCVSDAALYAHLNTHNHKHEYNKAYLCRYGCDVPPFSSLSSRQYHYVKIHNVKVTLKIYFCKHCGLNVGQVTHWVKHLLTKKHRRNSGDSIEDIKLKFPKYHYMDCYNCTDFSTLDKCKLATHLNKHNDLNKTRTRHSEIL